MTKDVVVLLGVSFFCGSAFMFACIEWTLKDFDVKRKKK